MSSVEYIDSVVLTTTASSVTFSEIPGDYEHLTLSCSTRFGSASGSKIRFNSDAGNTYSFTYFIGQSSASGSGRMSNVASIYNNLIWGDATVANSFTPYTISIPAYKNTNMFKTMFWECGTGGGLQGSNSEINTIVGLWRSTSAITSIELSPWNATTYQTGSTFTLWGVK